MLYCTISLQNYSLVRYFFPVYPILLPRVMNVKKNNIQHVFFKFLLSCLFGRDVGMGKWCSSYSARHLNPTFLYGGFFNLNEVTRAK